MAVQVQTPPALQVRRDEELGVISACWWRSGQIPRQGRGDPASKSRKRGRTGAGMEGHGFCERGRTAEPGGRALTWRSVLLINLGHEGEQGTPQAAAPEAGCSSGVFPFIFPSLLSLMPPHRELGLTHKDGEANPSQLTFSPIRNGCRDLVLSGARMRCWERR